MVIFTANIVLIIHYILNSVEKRCSNTIDMEKNGSAGSNLYSFKDINPASKSHLNDKAIFFDMNKYSTSPIRNNRGGNIGTMAKLSFKKNITTPVKIAKKYKRLPYERIDIIFNHSYIASDMPKYIPAHMF